MAVGPPFRRFFYAAWRRLPHRLRAVVVHICVPRAAAGAAVLLLDDEGRVLLVRHSYERASAWSLPGGWAKRGEELRHTAARELREELGINADIGRPLATGRGIFGDVSVVFEANWPAGTPLEAASFDPEIADARFFPVDSLPPLFGHARRMVDEALAVRSGRPLGNPAQTPIDQQGTHGVRRRRNDRPAE
jgi:ADP-ribose pyrophosphatase YjhB (NUDIX family)